MLYPKFPKDKAFLYIVLQSFYLPVVKGHVAKIAVLQLDVQRLILVILSFSYLGHIKIEIIKFCHCIFLLLSYLPVIWQPHVAVLIAHVIRIPVTHPGVHRDLLVILGSAPFSVAVVFVTSRSKSSNFAIVFSSYFLICL